MSVLRSLLYHPLFIAWTLALGILYLPLLLGPRIGVQRAARIWVNGALVLQRVVLGLGYEVRGRENLPKGAAVIAAKHQSAWETLVFHALFSDPVFVLKKSLLWLPVIGWYLLKTGQIAIDRKAGTKALSAMARAAKVALGRGSQVILFPEGHRQPPGVTGTFMPGVAMLAGEGVPIVPVALNSGLFWRRNAFVRHPGTIVMQVLPPLPAGLDRRAVVAELRARIEAATRALEIEALRKFSKLAERKLPSDPGRFEFWKNFICERCQFPDPGKLRAQFDAGTLRYVCLCGCNSFGIEVPADTSIEPIAPRDDNSKIRERFVHEANFHFRGVRPETESARILEIMLFADRNGNLTYVDISQCANSYPIPDIVEVDTDPYFVDTLNEASGDKVRLKEH